jgi:hypothetical protein
MKILEPFSLLESSTRPEEGRQQLSEGEREAETEEEEEEEEEEGRNSIQTNNQKFKKKQRKQL